MEDGWGGVERWCRGLAAQIKTPHRRINARLTLGDVRSDYHWASLSLPPPPPH